MIETDTKGTFLKQTRLKLPPVSYASSTERTSNE